MGTHDGGIDHSVFVIGILRQHLKQAGPHATLAPARVAQMYNPKVSEARGEITSGDAGAVSVKHRVYERSVDADVGHLRFGRKAQQGSTGGSDASPENGQCQTYDAARMEQEDKLHKQQQRWPRNEVTFLTSSLVKNRYKAQVGMALSYEGGYDGETQVTNPRRYAMRDITLEELATPAARRELEAAKAEREEEAALHTTTVGLPDEYSRSQSGDATVVVNHTGYSQQGSYNWEHDDTGSINNYSGCEDDMLSPEAEHEGWEDGYDY